MVRQSEVHCPSLAISPCGALAAFARFHPAAVSHGGESFFPDLYKTVAVDIALRKATVYIGAGADIPVHQHGGDIDASTAEE